MYQDIAQERPIAVANRRVPPPCKPSSIEQAITKSGEKHMGFLQWTMVEGNKFFPAGITSEKLIPGLYETKIDPMQGAYLEKLDFSTKGLLVFPESELILNDMRMFWDKKPDFAKYKRSHKFGSLIYGPPGNGKSSILKLILQDVFDRGGVGIKYTVPNLFIQCVRSFRAIQPDTPLIVLMEELDETLAEFGEGDTANLLDGQEVLENVIFLATTNYPEVFSERFMNRPNRFAYKYKMGHPNKKSRTLFFEHVFQEYDGPEMDLSQWVNDTDGLSIDHLNHLFQNVVVFGRKYSDSLKQLRDMNEEKISSVDDKEGMGFVKGARNGRI